MFAANLHKYTFIYLIELNLSLCFSPYTIITQIHNYVIVLQRKLCDLHGTY